MFTTYNVLQAKSLHGNVLLITLVIPFTFAQRSIYIASDGYNCICPSHVFLFSWIFMTVATLIVDCGLLGSCVGVTSIDMNYNFTLKIVCKINKIIVDLACEFNTSTDAFPPPPTCHAFLSCGSYKLNRIILYSN